SSCSCYAERVVYPTATATGESRGSSVVRVFGRATSPLCETILTASLPSKAACDVRPTDVHTCSISCECNLRPACLPKPRGNLKYTHVLERQRADCQDNSCQTSGGFEPRQTHHLHTCRVADCEPRVDRCLATRPSCVVECCQIPTCEPPKITKKEQGSQTTESSEDNCVSQNQNYERYETTSCRVERVTRRRTAPRSYSCARPSLESCVGRSLQDCSYYLSLVRRSENDLWSRIAECEMDLAAFECMMSSDVQFELKFKFFLFVDADYIREAIQKSQDLIRCDFQKIRCFCDNNDSSHRFNGNIEELWRETQRKLGEVLRMMDKIDRMRSRGWKDAEDAVRACDGYKIDGYALRVEYPRGRSFNSFRRGGGRGSGPSRRSDYRVIVTNLPPSGSWQDLKDHMREAGDVGFADVFKDGSGVVEFLRYEDMKYALKKLDDSKFRSHEGETSYIRVREERQYSRSRSRSRSYTSPRNRGRYSNSRSGSRSSSPRR
ncbi:unnamed protein product, partial [Mesocestoides corti]